MRHPISPHLDVERLPPSGDILWPQRLPPEPDLVQIAHKGIAFVERARGVYAAPHAAQVASDRKSAQYSETPAEDPKRLMFH